MQQLKQVLLFLSWYDYRIHRGVAQVAREKGWQLICPKADEERTRILQGWRGDGCITLSGDRSLAEYFHKLQVPLVDLGLNSYGFDVPRVVTDNMEIGRLAAEHFIDRGYTEVFVGSSQGVEMFRERRDALRVHMEAKGGKVTVLPQNKNAWAILFDQLKAIAEERGQSIHELSVAYFAYEDYSASELITSCLDNNLLVPENVAVLGIDNDDLINEGLVVGLSSVDSDQEGVGREGALLLSKMLENPDYPASNVIHRHPPKGVITRKSTDGFAVRNPMVSKALYWIHNNFQNGIQATDVARAMGVTQQGLQKAFANHHLRSPAEEIRHQRVQNAAQLLVNTSLKLQDITDQCGYNTVDTLINSFRGEFGTTPNKYRQAKRPSFNRLG